MATFIKKETNLYFMPGTPNSVIYQDFLALDLTCLGGYLGGAEAEPGAGKLSI